MAWKREEAAAVVGVWDMAGVRGYGGVEGVICNICICESGNQRCEREADSVHRLMARPPSRGQQAPMTIDAHTLQYGIGRRQVSAVKSGRDYTTRKSSGPQV